MILINLIEQKKKQVKRISFSFSVLLISTILIEIVAFAGLYFYQHSVMSSLNTRRIGLQKVALLVSHLKKEKIAVNRKITAIESLQDIKYNDLYFMNRFGWSLSPDIWITTLTKKKHTTVSGKAFSYSAVAKYMVSLSKIGKFKDVAFSGNGLFKSGGSVKNPIVSFKIGFK